MNRLLSAIDVFRELIHSK